MAEIVCANEAEWLEARYRGIGGSEAPTVCGVSHYETPYELAARKLRLVEGKEASEAMHWGHLLEPVVREEFCAETGRQVEYPGRWTIMTSERYPFMFCSLDGVVVDPKRGRGVKEIKTTHARSLKDLEEGSPLREMWDYQVQHQMAVMGMEWGSLSVLLGGQRLRWFDFEANKERQEEIIETEARFWGLISRGELPPVDAGAVSVLKKLHPNDNGETVILPGALLDDIDAYRAAQEAEKAAKQRQGLHKARILDAMGKNTFGVLPGFVVSLKTVEVKPFTVEDKTYRKLVIKDKRR